MSDFSESKEVTTITLAVVAYNEEAYLPRLLTDLRTQTYPHERIEVLLIDSASTDGTRGVMEDFAKEETSFAAVRVLTNEKKRQSAGWNVAIRAFSSASLVRVDAHARIPEDFVASCVKALETEDVAGGVRPTLCESDGAWARTLWMAEESLFGSSVSTARRGGEGAYVKSLFHACYRKEVLDTVGEFREDLGRTEDNEFHYRIRKRGYRIYRSPEIYSEQYVRPTFGRMLKQKAGNGFWIGRTLGIVPGCISVYHLVPFVFLAALITSGVLALFGHLWCLQLLGAMYGSVAVLMTLWSAFSLQREGERVPGFVFLLPLLFFCLHITYGAGTCAGLVSIPFGRKRG